MFPNIFIILCAATASLGQSFDAPPSDWVDRDESGAYRFGYATGDEGKHYHVASATADNVVSGRFGYKDPVTGGDLQTIYTAGRKGFRARGPHIARRMDLSQNRPPFSRPNNDGKYIPELDNVFDPNEDRGFDFSYRTPTHSKEEHADRAGDVQGRYSYVDDVGNRHSVDYIAGARTGFVVTNPVPDTFARARGGPLYFVGKRPGPKIRGFHAIQKALDGSYRFEASGPDHKRSEVSDAVGNRRGVYTYLDDKGVQHTVEYVAGPKIGYKVINNKKGSIYKPVLPFFPDSSTPGPFSPSFPTTTTLGPVSSGTAFGGTSASKFPPGSAFSPTKPTTEPTKFPIIPTSNFPGFSPSTPSPAPSGGGHSETPPGSSSATSSASPGGPSAPPKDPAPEAPAPAKPPTTTRLPTPSATPDATTTTFGTSDHKWDHTFDHGFNTPIHSNPKDWSVRPEQGSGSGFPFFAPSPPGGSAASVGASAAKPVDDCFANGTSSKPHRYRGSIKFGGFRQRGDEKEKREGYLEIPPGLAVRAHVQSLDIVPFAKRFASPSEALEAFGKSRGDRF